MTIIDILDYSESSQKIPSSLLNSSLRSKKINPLKVVLSHYLDFIVIVSLTMTINAAFSFYFEGFLPSWNVKEIYHSQSSSFTAALFPVILMSYYFFSYLFNDGQSLGLHSYRLRVAAKKSSFRLIFANAFNSSLICLTGGLSFFWKPTLKIVSHDYLYQNLLEIKDQHINLNHLLKSRKVIDIHESEKLAA
jgi:hypothetical protein